MQYLCSAWESLRSQDFLGWNALVLDDTPGGSPNLAELVGGWNDSRIAYRRNDGRHGIGAAWNACMEAIDGELFSLLHADDELEPDYLSTMVNLARDHSSAALYFCGATVVDAAGRPCFSLPDRTKDLIRAKGEPIVLSGAASIERLIIGNFIMCPTVMYRRSVVRGRRFSERHRFVLDLRFNLGVLFDGGLIVGTNRKAYRYRRHWAQATAQLATTGDRFAEELELFREIGKAASEQGWRRVAIAARTRPVFRIHAALSRRWKYAFA